MVALAYSTVHSAPALYCTRRARARWESRPETSYGGVRPQGPHCAGICLGICWHVDGCEGVLPLIWRGDKHRRVGGFIPIRPYYRSVLYRCLSRAGEYPRARNPVTVFRSLKNLTVVSTDSDMCFFLGILSTRSLVRSWRFSLEKSTADCTDSDGAINSPPCNGLPVGICVRSLFLHTVRGRVGLTTVFRFVS